MQFAGWAHATQHALPQIRSGVGHPRSLALNTSLYCTRGRGGTWRNSATLDDESLLRLHLWRRCALRRGILWRSALLWRLSIAFGAARRCEFRSVDQLEPITHYLEVLLRQMGLQQTPLWCVEQLHRHSVLRAHGDGRVLDVNILTIHPPVHIGFVRVDRRYEKSIL